MLCHTLMKILILSLVIIVIPFAVYAHGDETSFEVVVGEELVDIGYSIGSAPDVLRLDFALFEEKTRNDVPFESVWVNLSKGPQTVFAGPVAHGEFGRPGISILISEVGEYTLSARFEKTERDNVEVSFPISIVEDETKKNLFPINAVWSLLVILLVVGAYFMGKKS